MDYKDYIGKPFGEILEDLREREGRVKLGGSESSAFYWIDECKELTDGQAEMIEAELDAWSGRRITTAHNEVRRLIGKKPKLEDYVSKIAFNEDIEGCGTVEEFIKTLTEWIASVDKAKRSMIEKRKEHAERVKLLDKEVRDAYLCEASWQKGDLVLLLEGIENGKYWDHLEAKGEKLDTSKYKNEEDNGYIEAGQIPD